MISNKKKLLIITIIIVSLVSIISYIIIKINHMTIEHNKKAVTRLLDEVWSKGNLTAANDLIASSYTIRHDPGDPWDGKTLDLKTYKERVQHSRSIFPDQAFHIIDLVTDADKVSLSWNFTGTYQGNIPNLPNINKAVEVSGITIYYFDRGEIIGHRQIVDRFGFLEQIELFKKND